MFAKNCDVWIWYHRWGEYRENKVNGTIDLLVRSLQIRLVTLAPAWLILPNCTVEFLEEIL
jgi:hypothetical protein